MQVAKDLNDFNDELESKYGPIDVNIETGEYASQEDSSSVTRFSGFFYNHL